MATAASRQNRRRASDLDRLRATDHFLEADEKGGVTCLVTGPDDTPFAGRKWRVRMSLPKEYPFRSPSVGFVDRIYHPNIDERSGTICLNALNHEWTPVYNLVAIMETLLPQLLTYPNPDDPLNSAAATLLRTDKDAYEAKCLACQGYVVASV